MTYRITPLPRCFVNGLDEWQSVEEAVRWAIENWFAKIDPQQAEDLAMVLTTCLKAHGWVYDPARAAEAMLSEARHDPAPDP